MSQAWMIASGKGGVGKSAITAALACTLAKRRMRTAAVDMDVGLRSLDMLLGLENKVIYDLGDVARKDCKLAPALVDHYLYPELSLLPASQLGSQQDISINNLLRITRKLKKRYSCIIMDAPAGMARGVETMLPSADICLLVVTPDDLCIRDAERMIELVRQYGKPTPQIIVNRIVPKLVKSGEMYSPRVVAQVLDAPLLGYIPEDDHVRQAQHHHQPLTEFKCPAQAAIERIAARMLGAAAPMPSLERRRLFRRKEEGLAL